MFMIVRQAIRWRIMLPTMTRSFQKLNKSRMRNVDMKALNSALKPFLFLVHPDLFGKFPEKRKINEESLMALNSFLQAYVAKDKQPTLKKLSLKFFIRNPKHHGPITEISVNLYDTSPIIIIENILTSAGLPGILKKEKKHPQTQKQWKENYYNYINYPPHYENKKDATKKLVNFFERNSSIAKLRLNKTLELRQQNAELIEKFCKDFQLKSLVVESDWRISLQYGYLKNVYECLCRHKKEILKAAGWRVVLSTWAGVNACGTINLNIEDEPINWIKLVSSVEMFSTLVADTDNLLRDVSEILGGLRIVKAVHGMKNVHLKNFHKYINDLYLKLSYVTNGPDINLSNHKAVLGTSPVEVAAILPNGSFLIPLSMGSADIISFLNASFDEARDIKNVYERQLAKEKQLIDNCMGHLKWSSLGKSQDIDPTQMINCCKNLLDLNCALTKLDVDVKVDQYYHMSADGVLTIPWNWKTS